ncbi:hypothetical protein [Candidatus Harpocratesius sp.]
MIKIGVCANLDLEYRFRRMSANLESKYYKHQIQNLKKLSKVIQTAKLDLLIIAGNIFGRTKPSNRAIQFIYSMLEEIGSLGTQIVIVPGTHEMPLYFSNDSLALEIFKSIPNVHILIGNYQHSNTIEKPFCEIMINNSCLHFYGIPNPLIPPNLIKYKLDLDEEVLSFFIIHDLMGYKTDIKKISLEFLEKIDKNSLFAIFIGGNLPKGININDYKNQLIIAPNIHPNSFKLEETNTSRLKIFEFDEKKEIFEIINETTIPISNLSIKHLTVNLEEIETEKWNDTIMDVLRKESGKNVLMQLSLVGNILKNDYHIQIKTYKYLELGQIWNFYFELDDNVIFGEFAEGIEELSFLDELEKYVQNFIKQNPSDRKINQYYQKAMQKIREDYLKIL